MGPITDSWVLFSNDPNDGDILNTTRRALNKYEVDYEYSKRDLELYEEGEKDKLQIVYEGGKVALVIEKIKKGYGYENRLFVDYREPHVAINYLEKNKPQRASTDDF